MNRRKLMFFRWSHKNIFYKSLIINTIYFADSMNSYYNKDTQHPKNSTLQKTFLKKF